MPGAALIGLAALVAAAPDSTWARALLAVIAVLGVLAGIGWSWPEDAPLPRMLTVPAYVAAGNLAVLHAWLRLVAGRAAPVWEPTRRGAPV